VSRAGSFGELSAALAGRVRCTVARVVELNLRALAHDGRHLARCVRVLYQRRTAGAQHTLLNLLTRLCACVGGVIATFTFGMRYLSTLRYLVVGRCTPAALTQK